jgi:integrase
LRAITATALLFGFRKGELLNLRVRQIDLLNREIRLEGRDTKNGAAKAVVMTGNVAVLLTALATGKTGEEFVFTRSAGKRVKNFRKLWEKVCEAAGVPGLVFHDLRRSAVRDMVRGWHPGKGLHGDQRPQRRARCSTGTTS